MGEYITEYVSSGRKNSKKSTLMHGPEDISIDGMISWFKDMGIDGYTYTENRHCPESLEYGELIYRTGPCDGREAHNWIALYANSDPEGRNWTQELCMWIGKEEEKGRLGNAFGNKMIEMKVSKTIELMKKMILDPEKEIIL